MKKTFILVVLFVLPIVAYLFFASGVNNFGRLPVLTENIRELNVVDSEVKFKNHITILGFLGSSVDNRKGNAFNLNQKIYKRFHEFKDFQFVMMLPYGAEEKSKELKEELATLADVEKWHFVFDSPEKIKAVFESLQTDISLGEDLGSPYVFVIDKDLALRGRTDDEDDGTKYGFNSSLVSDLNNKMVDDVKIVLAEYRLALKKNNAERTK